jgi:chorismate lyase
MSGYSSQLNWYKRKQSATLNIPDQIINWLFDPSSLTERIIENCSGCFRVHLISQKRTTPTPDEIRALGLRYRSHAIIRQVILYCDDVPWVYARSVIPMTTLKGPLRRLGSLGNRPLGAVLFSDRSIERGEVEITSMASTHSNYIWTQYKGTEEIWGRRSVFKQRRKKLLVSEFFLPNMFY